MKTKLNFFFDALTPKVGRANLRQHEFTFRRFFAVCLLAIVAQVGIAGTWSGNQVTYDFNAYSNDFTLTGGSVLCETIGDKDLYTMEDRNGNTFHHALDAIFAAQNVDHWSIATDDTGRHLYQGGNGNRYLSISNLFIGCTIAIKYDNSTENNSISLYDGSYCSQNSDVWVDGTRTHTITYTLLKDGPLDLVVPRRVKIRNITIDYTGATGHPMFFSRNDANIVYYKDNIPYYRCQLSSRNFSEPTISSATSYSYSTIETPSGYPPAVLKKSNNVIVTPHDVMMNNEGVSQINASDGTHTDSYRLEIWDNDASTSITDITNGKKFTITSPGVLHNRTITIPGVEVKFSVTNGGVEPNTTVAYNDGEHIVAFTNDEDGWWDRVPHNNYSWPEQGTFYSFKATAKGKLRFGGIKKVPNSGSSGKVYLVKLETIHEDNRDKEIYPQAYLFTSEQNGYLTNENFTSITYSTHQNDAHENISDASSYTITTNNGADNCITLKPGEVYYLQGEANSGDNIWAPYLLEWFSYELDNTLSINKTYTVANKKGYELSSSDVDGVYYTAEDVEVEGNPTTTITGVKGSVSSANVSLENGHLKFTNIVFNQTEDNKMGGAIKVRLSTALDNYIDFTLTIPYGMHVWDFRSTDDQDMTHAARPGAWFYTDAELCSMMKANSAANWKIVWKVRKSDNSQFEDPIMVPDGAINGDNAFCMDNTAGLVFVAGARSFGARDTRSLSGVNNPDNIKAEETVATNLLWLKGNATVYFPGVTAGQYIKIYTYRHSDGKGETFSAKNLMDLDNKHYNPNDKFIMRGMWEERYPAYKGDNIKGCAIFRVPTLPTTSNPIDNIPQLTLCDDGWMKIYRIEIMDEFEPDIILTDDNPGGAFCPVDYDGKFGSVVVRKKNGTNIPTLKSYTATVGQTQCQHANTCDYQIIADEGVVDINKEVWTSGGGVNYNRLNLRYNKSGLVRIVQREKVCLLGSNNNWTETGKDGEGNLTYENIASASRPTGYVIDKNEYYVNVGELTVQDYPYTWDFTSHNMYQGSSVTKETEGLKAVGSNWDVSENTCSQKAVASPKIDFGVGTGQTQNLKIDKALFPQGAQLMSNDGIVVAETEGLGVSRPTKTKTYYYYSTVNDVFDKRERNYDGYTLEDYAIKIDGNDLTGIGEINIPEVGDGMYIFVKASAAPISITPVPLDAGISPLSISTTDIFNVKAKSEYENGVYLYRIGTGAGNTKQDVVLTFASNTEVEIVAVTDIVKTINNLGYASESRGRAIDHTYEGVLTTNDVNAYIITTEDEYGKTYNFKGYPMVKKTRVTTDIVPANMGIVLFKEGHTGGSFSSPLFVPAVNNAPAYDAGSDAFWQSNWMIPNVQSKQHYNEETSRSAASETSLNTLPYYISGSIGTPDWKLKQTVDATIFGSYSSDPVRYVDLSGFKELRIYQTDSNPAVRCFFYNADGTSSVTVSITSIPSDAPALTQVGSGENKYYSVDLKAIYDKYGQVKLIGIKAATSDGRAYVSDVKAISYVNPDPTWCTKFVMATSYYTYSDISGTFSEEKTATVESFYRMILDKNESTAATNNTLGANKALLLIPRDKLPEALWNKTPGSGGSGARRGVIYIDLDDFEEQEATSVASETIINRSTDDDVYYSISGTRINGKPTTKGFYIHNGKKVSVR